MSGHYGECRKKNKGLIKKMAKKLEKTVKTFSAVYLSGARQCGKSTFVRNILSPDKVNYITFDTSAVMASAKQDPEAFISNLPKGKLNIIDVPNLAKQ